MSTYYWDLGIDWDAATDIDGDYLLQTGFVQETPTAAAYGVEPPVKLTAGSTVQFMVYDTTDSGSNTASIDTVEVRCKKLDGTGKASHSPFDGDSSSIDLSPSGSSGTPYSTAFEASLPQWKCTPAQTIASDASGGRFVVKITVKATDKDGNQRTWQVDPEMLIGTAG